MIGLVVDGCMHNVPIRTKDTGREKAQNDRHRQKGSDCPMLLPMTMLCANTV